MPMTCTLAGRPPATIHLDALGEPGLVLPVETPLVLEGDLLTGRFLAFRLHGTAIHQLRIRLRCYRAGHDRPGQDVCTGFLPGVRATWVFDLDDLAGGAIYLKRTPGRLKTTMFGERFARTDIARLELVLEASDHPQTLAMTVPELLAAAPPTPVAGGTMLDPFGQWTAKDWPGKTRDETELTARLHEPVAGAWPAGWSRWGGDAAVRFEATGAFRTHHDGRRWWLVDPDGHPCWTAGLDCVGPGVPTALIPGIDAALSWVPPREGAFARAWTTDHWQQPTLDYGIANLVRAHGDGWRAAWMRRTDALMRGWGFNLVANWSLMEFAHAHGWPYVIPMRGFPATPVNLFRDLPDVFDPAYAASARTWAQQLAGYADDTHLVGYFMANEPHWAFGRFNLAAELLDGPPGTATRRELVRFLRGRHADDAALSAAWGFPVTAAALEAERLPRLDHRSPAAAADLWEFSKLIVREFARIPAEAARAVAPLRLNLGLRWAWISSELLFETGAHCDIFTINCYGMLPDTTAAAEIARRTGRPTMIGEFHFGALDAGLPGDGLRAVASQAERGVAYRRYVETAAADPNLIGAHYFTLLDESALGRFDGENWNIGLMDVCHRVYPEFAAAVAETNRGIYEVAHGRRAPASRQARETRKVAF